MYWVQTPVKNDSSIPDLFVIIFSTITYYHESVLQVTRLLHLLTILTHYCSMLHGLKTDTVSLIRMKRNTYFTNAFCFLVVTKQINSSYISLDRHKNVLLFVCH